MMYHTDAVKAEIAAQRYIQALDLLYYMGCTYNVKEKDLRDMCDHMGVVFEDLQDHNLKGNLCQ